MKAFDRRVVTVDGTPVVRLETMGELGEVNHMIVVKPDGRALMIDNGTDAALFEQVLNTVRFFKSNCP